MLDHKLTLLIHSCDKFSDLWDAHTGLLAANWPDRRCRTVILTDAPTDAYYDDIEIVSAGSGKEITDRIRHLLPMVDTEYVLVTLDDYFPIYPIDTRSIERLVAIMDREGYDYIRLHDRPHGPRFPTSYRGVYRIALEGHYAVNLYSGLWRKSFIEKTLSRDALNAWQFEVTLTEMAKKAGGICAMSTGNEFPILDVVRKGYLLRPAARYLRKHDLYHGPRRVMPLSYAARLWVKTWGIRALYKLPFANRVKLLLMDIGMVKSYSGEKLKKDLESRS